MKKRWTLIPSDDVVVQQLQDSLKIHPVLCRILAQRDINTFEDARTFFRPDPGHLHDPFLMKDMDLAVERLEAALAGKEKILLYGDYDVDGTTCVALLYDFLSRRHVPVDYYIPDRYREGYGLGRTGIDYAIEQGASLLIAMDCGIRATEAVAYANAAGLDIIICDHHLPEGEIPRAVAVLDPMQPTCNYPYKYLSGCGVVFKLVQAYVHRHGLPEAELHDLLDILVLSIAADIVPMTGENRVLASLGLQRLNRTNRIGLQALIGQSRRKSPLTISDIVFGLAPMINAAGRLGDARLAVKLLLSANKQVAADHARMLQHQNEKRKEHDRNILLEAKEQFVQTGDWKERRSILLYSESWHKGVVGIAAARMVEHFHRPTILLTHSNGMATGSARSVPGFNIYQAIRSCADLLTNFGGHDHAAGMTLPIEAVAKFEDRFEAAVRQTISPELLQPELRVNAVLDFADISQSFWRVLKQFAPFGPGNRSPVFVTKNVADTGHSRLLKGGHLRLSVRQKGSPTMTGIAFGMGEHFARIRTRQPFHIAYKLEEEYWRGDRVLRMVLRDFWFAK